MSFPHDFAWGVATAAYQVEGGWDVDGKGLNIWDDFTHSHPELVTNADTGDVACDSYHKLAQDLQIIGDLGVSHYRFSISWSRLLPTGLADSLNPNAAKYYNELIDGLINIGVAPVVTMYHFDIPLSLEKNGGWLSSDIAQIFTHYANILFNEFGDRVKHWITINEPWVVAIMGYEVGRHPPRRRSDDSGGREVYTAAHNMILAHAKVYKLYNERYRGDQAGKVGIAINSHWSEPRDSNSPSDIGAANRALEFELGWFAGPIFGNGEYPHVMREAVAGMKTCPLPEFTSGQKEMVRESSDFFGLNFYSSHICFSNDTVKPVDKEGFQAHTIHGMSLPTTGWHAHRAVQTSVDDSWPRSSLPWLNVTPWGLRKMLKYISDKYSHGGKLPVYIFENGFCDNTGERQDDRRISYYTSHLQECQAAISEDGVNLRGYFAWSLMDNFEWCDGYTQKFGLYHVDFNDPNRKRTAKESAKYYAKIVKQNNL